jgi:hypothetical protein
MRLPLTGAQRQEYLQLISGPHDFDVEADVLTMEERHIATIRRKLRDDDGRVGFVDGQIDFQRDGDVKRTGSLTFYDPDHALHLDNDSPFAGAVFADRLIRVRHIVELPDAGIDVHTACLVGSPVQVGRDGTNLTLTVHDKTVLATTGRPPYTVKKGRNAVDAIRSIMEDCTGERRFRFPKGHKARLKKAYNVGWKDEASPWRVCQKIADAIDMQLIYAGDGYLVLRKRPHSPVVTITEGGIVLDPSKHQVAGLTGLPRVDYDVTSVKNVVRVTGHRKAKKGHKQVKFTEVARARQKHALSPEHLGRHGVARPLPLLIDDSSIHKNKDATERAKRELRDNLPMSASYSVTAVPLFHLDYGDPIRVRTDMGDAIVPFTQGSFPLGLGGDASYGTQKQVSTPRRNG